MDNFTCLKTQCEIAELYINPIVYVSFSAQKKRRHQYKKKLYKELLGDPRGTDQQVLLPQKAN